MIKKILIALLLIISVASGCKKDYQRQEIENSKVELGKIVNHTVSLEQANKVAILHSVYPSQLKRVKKKSNENWTSSTPYEVQKQKLEKTVKSTFAVKNGEIEPSLYVINYNEGGFVIVSGDDRMVPILAYGDKNSFRETDTSKIDNPGLKFWLMENLRYISALRSGKIKEQNVAVSAWKDLERKSQLTLGNHSVLVDWPPCEDEGDLNEVFAGEDWEVYLTTANFDQDAPWNDFVFPHANCFAPKVGCVAVATATIMKYWEYPTSLYDWSQISNTGPPSWETKQLLADNYDDLDGRWVSNCNATSAWYWSSNWNLNGHGYSTDDFDDFNSVWVKGDIANGQPVILAGGTHEWVASGVRVYTVSTCLEYGTEEDPPIQWRNPPAPTYGWVETNSYMWLYMNWGWGGYDNDWYTSYIWNPVQSGSNYSSNMKALTGIHP